MSWCYDIGQEPYAKPTSVQVETKERLAKLVRAVVEELETLTVPQQREILAMVPVGGIFCVERPELVSSDDLHGE